MSVLHPSVEASLARFNPALLAHIQADEARRARLLRFVEAVSYGNRWTLRLGDRVIPYARLSTDALEDLATDLAADFWSTKKRVRESRAIYAARQGRAA